MHKLHRSTVKLVKPPNSFINKKLTKSKSRWRINQSSPSYLSMDLTNLTRKKKKSRVLTMFKLHTRTTQMISSIRSKMKTWNRRSTLIEKFNK
jgi:hypothetical protein